MNKIINKEISFLQAIGIILVVLGHSGKHIPYLTKWIYSFHMPLFMFISGYLFNYNISGYKDFFIKKTKRLLVPYFIISTIAYIPKYLLGRFAMRPLVFSFKGYLNGFLYPENNPIIFFWFLPTLFFIMLISLFLLRCLKSKNTFYILLIGGFILAVVSKKYISIKLLGTSIVLYYFLFFTFGIFYRKYQILICSFLKLNEKKICLILNFVLVLNCLSNIPIIRVEYDIFISIIGILSMISLSKIYNKENYNFLNFLYGKSYTIYLLSWFPQVFIRIVGYQILNLSWTIVLPISFFFGIFIPYIANLFIIFITNKFKKISFLRIVFGI